MKARLCVRLLLALLAGAGPAVSAVHAQEAGSDGAMLFTRKCAVCHAAGLTGALMLERRLGPDRALLDQRTDLQGNYISGVVRGGILGMPPLTRVELPDGELQAIIIYLTTEPARR